ncbi:hypothetical protein [Paenibacillus sp. 1001270B_150601_E10]|uniref:hypothetical protein n=1 Tax=Paenibacillus sp. 1001270B_150601_E10 TaxID=2787079 RepID=UPI00189F97AB|nr:hypothetical protein [Paenibacillus sp. 1001270B_150601_E10]
MSRIIFVEYRIDPSRREEYLQLVQAKLASYSNVVLYEGTDQPNVFVEQYMNTTEEQYLEMKRIRHSEESDWDLITDCIPGGRAKLHIWEFKSR